MATTLVVPVRHLLQGKFLITLQQDGDIVSDHSNQEGDEDDGQHHPQANVGVQQQLRLSHGRQGVKAKPWRTLNTVHYNDYLAH